MRTERRSGPRVSNLRHSLSADLEDWHLPAAATA